MRQTNCAPHASSLPSIPEAQSPGFLSVESVLASRPVNNTAASVQFRVIGSDQVVYGPVELPELVEWVRTGRVQGDHWVYLERDDAWRRAVRVPELQIFFGAKPTPTEPGKPQATVLTGADVPTGLLRRVKVLAELSQPQLERMQRYVEVLRVPRCATVVKHGTPGDAMFMILEGELRVSLIVSGTEKLLTILQAGEFFGECCLMDHGLRSADVITNSPSTVVRVSTDGFARLMDEAPDIAVRILFAMSKTLTVRIRADNRRYGNALAFGPMVV